MKYLILIYGNPKSRAVWEGFSDEQRAEGYRLYAGLHADLVASGELIASEALADPSLARRVPARDGVPWVTDGPFAEVKEQLGGFFLVQCENMERARQIISLSGNRPVPFLHRLQQCRLGARTAAVDFIRHP